MNWVDLTYCYFGDYPTWWLGSCVKGHCISTLNSPAKPRSQTPWENIAGLSIAVLKYYQFDYFVLRRPEIHLSIWFNSIDETENNNDPGEKKAEGQSPLHKAQVSYTFWFMHVPNLTPK